MTGQMPENASSRSATRAATTSGSWLCADCGYPTPYKDFKGDGDPVCALCFIGRHPGIDFKIIEVASPRNHRHV